MLESDYAYSSGAKGDDTTDCLYSASKTTSVTVESWGHVNFPSKVGRIVEMKTALQKQPIATALAANNKYIHSYSNGIIDASDCWTM